MIIKGVKIVIVFLLLFLMFFKLNDLIIRIFFPTVNYLFSFSVNNKEIEIKSEEIEKNIFLNSFQPDIYKNKKIRNSIFEDIDKKEKFIKNYFNHKFKIIHIYNIIKTDGDYHHIFNNSELETVLNITSIYRKNIFTMKSNYRLTNMKYRQRIQFEKKINKNSNESEIFFNKITQPVTSLYDENMEKSFYQNQSHKVFLNVVTAYTNDVEEFPGFNLAIFLIDKDFVKLFIGRDWMHEFIESIILRFYTGKYNFLDESEERYDVLIRWIQDGLTEFFTYKFFLEEYSKSYNAYHNDKIILEFDNDIDILNWGISVNHEAGEKPPFINKRDYYDKSFLFFHNLEKKHGYEIIEDLLKFMYDTEIVTSEKVLIYLEEKIGKGNLEELMGKNYLERVEKYRKALNNI